MCILIFGVEIVYSQNFNALKKEADGEFLKGQFLEAKSKYRQLLAADQKSIDFNYKYGVCIYHDENNNDKCDKNFFGIPTEGYGFSNNKKPVLSIPSFEECSVNLTSDKSISIKVLY